MKECICDVAVIGAGPAGLAAALAAKKAGAEHVIIVERDERLGGILQQCIHPGFGLNYFNEELTGPEYGQRFIDRVNENGIQVMTNTTALELHKNQLMCVNTAGMISVNAGAIVLAMGCRERTRFNLMIPGSRPAGIYTAGTAQRLLNIQGQMVGKNIVILGSGDIGMIMARRLTLEGAKVKAVVEIMPYLAGLTRNKVQCLDDFGIPLMLSHTVCDITGVDRVESVTVAPVDEKRKPIKEKAEIVECDTLLLSVGLIPENELTKHGGIALSQITKGAIVNQYMQTQIENVFACGNVLHVNDLVDNVTRESEAAGRSAALYAMDKLPEGTPVEVISGENIRYVCPQYVVPVDNEDVKLFFRVSAPNIGARLQAESGGKELYSRKTISVNPGEIESVTIKAQDVGALKFEILVNAKQGE
ncbi:MAG: FAD-dependent oxidoreductase [Clostridiaceae bacterium]|nr:FAD-dependent oxidoreductase [Clostridiaceae bacterium]